LKAEFNLPFLKAKFNLHFLKAEFNLYFFWKPSSIYMYSLSKTIYTFWKPTLEGGCSFHCWVDSFTFTSDKVVLKLCSIVALLDARRLLHKFSNPT